MHLTIGLLFVTAGSLLWLERGSAHPVLALLLALVGSGFILIGLTLASLQELATRRAASAQSCHPDSPSLGSKS